MRRELRFRDLLFGPGLIVAVIGTLGAATLLVVAGLAWELVQLRTTVVTEAPASLVRQATAPSGRQPTRPARPAAEAPDTDPADPAPHGSSPTLVAAIVEPDHDHEHDLADQPATASAAPDDAVPAPAPPGAEATPIPPPVVAAEPAPAPAAIVARRRTEPGPRGAPRGTADLPIVMYHHVGPLPPNPDVFRKDLTVSPALFEDELQHLVEQGIETVSLDDLMEHYAGGPALPAKSVVLTFDDGYDDNYEFAFPLLQQYKMVGTFFIVTEFVGRPGYLTWEQIQEMDAAGMSIEAHSATHADLSVVRGAELQRQLVEPKRVLEEQLGHPVRFLAYPAGKYNAGTIAATRAAGYVAAVTVIHGTSHPSASVFELTRVRARGADTATGLLTKLTPASWRR